MDRGFHQLQSVLAVFRDRAKAALDALAQEDWDRFDEAMLSRKIAFHNFRAIDHQCLAQQLDCSQDSFCRELAQDLQVIDEKLSLEIEKRKDKLADKLNRIAQHKAQMGRFRSGQAESPSFQKTV